MPEHMALGAWLKQRRKELDLTQEELAQQVGCSAIAIRKIEAGEYRPSKQIASNLAEVLEVQVDERELFVRFARGEKTTTGPASVDVDRYAPWRDLHRRATEDNLPAQLTRLIGRERVVDEVCTFLLHANNRLVTLTGPPGVGKTRLSIEAAARSLYHFEGGVFFVPLAFISDPDLVIPAIAGVLGLKESAERTLVESLRGYLRDRRILLVLDNVEQVVEAAPQLENLLGACGRLVVLVTSREALHVQGEQQFHVAPLELPDPSLYSGRALLHMPSMKTLAANPAVALFVERARAVKPGFELTEENAGTVAAICIELDGLPLAIEIAAVRVNLLSCQAILVRLQGRLKLLVGSSRHTNARQQTLRGAIDWSYKLLDRPEQRLFARLGVFTGGYTLAAAEAVCNARGDLGIEVLDGVESLLDKSLLRHEEGVDAEDRFSMLETLREYALEALFAGKTDAHDKVDSVGADALIERHHAEYYLSLAEAAEPELRGTQQATWLDRLESDHANLRAALQWSAKHDADIVLRLVAALWRYWWLRGYLSEGREWLKAVLAEGHPTNEHPIWRARALRGAGWLAYAQGDYVAARTLLRRSLALFEENGDKRGIANSLDNLGAVAFTLDDNRSARSLYGKSLAIRKEIGDRHAIATSMNNLGLVATAQEDYLLARPLLEESLALYRDLKDGYGIATSLNNLALMCIREGKRPLALPLLRESLSIRAAMGDKYAVAYSLAGFAAYLDCNSTTDEDAHTATSLLAATHALLETIGARLENAYLVEYNRTLAARRLQLGELAFATAWDRGLALSMEQAIAEALSVE